MAMAAATPACPGPATTVAVALGRLTPRPRRLLVGFSGGADSTALLLLTATAAPTLGMAIEAVHFDHGLRGPASRADAAWCRRFCEIRSLPCRTIPLPVRSSQRPGEGMEAAARRLRLAAWRDLAGPEDAVVLGHHADDRAENLLLRLLRGANCSGLTSLRGEQVVDGVRIVRPLLALRKAELVAHLHAQGIRRWREDVSNQDPAMRRNFLRQNILPALRAAIPETDAALTAALSALDADAAFLEAATDTALAPHLAAESLPLGFLRDLAPALRPRVLRRWLMAHTGHDLVPDAALLARLDDLLARARTLSGESRRIPLPTGATLVLGRGHLRLADDASSPLPPPPEIAWPWARQATLPWGDGQLRRTRARHGVGEACLPNANSALFPADALPTVLTVRPWRAGDRMIPFGRRRPVSLKKLFVDCQILGAARLRHPVMADPGSGAILWVAGLRRSALLPVAGPRQPAVLLAWQRHTPPSLAAG
jgi:tRNA(Ile)-lysidine synthase